MLKKFLLKKVINFIKNKTEISEREAKIATKLLIASKLYKALPLPLTLVKGKTEKEIDEIRKNIIQNAKDHLKEKRGPYGVFQRFLKEWHPNCKEKFIKNFVYEGLIRKRKIREKVRKEGSYTPTTVLISPLMRCNYRCVGCYAQNYSKADDMPEKLFERIIKEGEEMGVHFYTCLLYTSPSPRDRG